MQLLGYYYYSYQLPVHAYSQQKQAKHHALATRLGRAGVELEKIY
jgi:hypothetical protein